MIVQGRFQEKMIKETFTLSALRLTDLSVLGMRKDPPWDWTSHIH